MIAARWDTRWEILDFVRRIIDKSFTARIAVDARRLREGRSCPPTERLFVNPLDRPDTQGVPPQRIFAATRILRAFAAV
jgi:hypothetical protein